MAADVELMELRSEEKELNEQLQVSWVQGLSFSRFCRGVDVFSWFLQLVLQGSAGAETVSSRRGSSPSDCR